MQVLTEPCRLSSLIKQRNKNHLGCHLRLVVSTLSWWSIVCCALLYYCRATGRSSAQGVLADSLLSPLVLGQGLLPVQVQLLVKLAKDAVGLQPR